MKHLSIIIPMYNVEPYVERCLRSLEDQNIAREDFEIICINDGSTDNSREVVIRLQHEFGNITLMDQENQGVSKARNNGIDIAIGEYLLFIDPDDFVDTNCFYRVLENAERYKAQVSFLGFTFLNENGTIRNRIFNENQRQQVFSGTEAYFLARGDGWTDPDRTWAILFSRDFMNMNKLRYLPDVPYLEDGELVARLLCLAERCIFDGQSFYQRTTRPGSATNSKLIHSKKATNGFMNSANNLRKFQQEKYLNEKQREFLNQPIVKFVLLGINSSMGWKQKDKLKATIKTLKEYSLRRVNLEGCNHEYRTYGKAYNLSPYLSAIALLLLPRIQYIYRLLFRK